MYSPLLVVDSTYPVVLGAIVNSAYHRDIWNSIDYLLIVPNRTRPQVEAVALAPLCCVDLSWVSPLFANEIPVSRHITNLHSKDAASPVKHHSLGNPIKPILRRPCLPLGAWSVNQCRKILRPKVPNLLVINHNQDLQRTTNKKLHGSRRSRVLVMEAVSTAAP